MEQFKGYVNISILGATMLLEGFLYKNGMYILFRIETA